MSKAIARTIVTDTPKAHKDHEPVRSAVAVVLAGGLLLVSAFQVALTFGAPFGAAAMGGTNTGRLPDGTRIVPASLPLCGSSQCCSCLARGGRPLVALPEAVSRRGTWVLVGFLGLGAMLNFASSSPWERFGWGPFTIVLFILGVLLARGGSGHPDPRAI